MASGETYALPANSRGIGEKAVLNNSAMEMVKQMVVEME